MARIRHGYTQIAPIVTPYFTTATHDDIAAVLLGYGSLPATTAGSVVYGLTTSGGMIGLIVSMVGGVLAGVVTLIVGASGGSAIWIGIAGGVLVMGTLTAWATLRIPRTQAGLSVRFPSPDDSAAAE